MAQGLYNFESFKPVITVGAPICLGFLSFLSRVVCGLVKGLSIFSQSFLGIYAILCMWLNAISPLLLNFFYLMVFSERNVGLLFHLSMRRWLLPACAPTWV